MSDAAAPQKASMSVGSRVALAACVLAMAAVAIWHPVEYLDGEGQQVDRGRRFAFAGRQSAPGVPRIRLMRLLIEEGLLLAFAAGIVRAGRQRG
jgi:hypothetical protein